MVNQSVVGTASMRPGVRDFPITGWQDTQARIDGQSAEELETPSRRTAQQRVAGPWPALHALEHSCCQASLTVLIHTLPLSNRMRVTISASRAFNTSAEMFADKA